LFSFASTHAWWYTLAYYSRAISDPWIRKSNIPWSVNLRLFSAFVCNILTLFISVYIFCFKSNYCKFHQFYYEITLLDGPTDVKLVLYINIVIFSLKLVKLRKTLLLT
jgi:hypothetical protein